MTTNSAWDWPVSLSLLTIIFHWLKRLIQRKQWSAWQAALPKQALRLFPSQSSWLPVAKSAIAKSTNAHGTAFVQTEVQYDRSVIGLTMLSQGYD